MHDEQGKAPLLSVFGGKLTTYRKLAEHAMEKLAHYYPGCGPAWTKNATLQGGDIGGDRDGYAANCAVRTAGCRKPARRYARTYGSQSELIWPVPTASAIWAKISATVCMKPNCYLTDKEWVVELDDAIWRRTKLGMWLDEAQQARVKAGWRNTRKPSAVSGFLSRSVTKKGRYPALFFPLSLPSYSFTG